MKCYRSTAAAAGDELDVMSGIVQGDLRMENLERYGSLSIKGRSLIFIVISKNGFRRSAIFKRTLGCTFVNY
jgi:hypothetical protein